MPMGWNRFICTFSEILLLGLLLSFAQQASAAVSLKILNYPSEVKINNQFALTASISGLVANHVFPLKVGVSTGSTYYGYGLIKNGDQWAGYNDPCGSAPTFKADESGHWEGSVNAKIGSTAKVSDGKLRFKICDPDKSSDSYPLKLLAMDQPPEPPKKPDPPFANSDSDSPPVSQTDTTEEVGTSIPISNIQTPKLTSNNPNSPTSKIEYRLPATLSAVPAVLGQEVASDSPREATSTSSNSAKTKTSEQPWFLIARVLAIITVVLFLTIRIIRKNSDKFG